MISGIHAIIFSTDAEADRTFFRDVLGFESVDAGDGWLIFASPPAELAVHPGEEGGRHQLYLMCDDLDTTLAELQGKGVEVTRTATEQSWGRVASIGLPGGGDLSIYQPRHRIPTHR